MRAISPAREGKNEMFAIWLIVDNESGVQSDLVADEPSKAKAFDRARRAAGPGAEFRKRGVSVEYWGPNGVASIK
jgi:hypothetical protein